MKTFIASRLLVLLVTLSVLTIVAIQLTQSGDSNRIRPSILVSICAINLLVLFVFIKSAISLSTRKSILKAKYPITASGKSTIVLTIPGEIRHGVVLLFISQWRASWDYFNGRVSLKKLQTGGSAIPLDILNIPRRQPLLRVPWHLPQWLPVSEAGNHLELWPMSVGKSRSPLSLELSLPICSNEKLQLDFDLQSTFQGTMLEQRLPIGSEVEIEVIVQQYA